MSKLLIYKKLLLLLFIVTVNCDYLKQGNQPNNLEGEINSNKNDTSTNLNHLEDDKLFKSIRTSSSKPEFILQNKIKKISFGIEDSFEPNLIDSKFNKFYLKNKSFLKNDLPNPKNFLNAVVNDQITSSNNRHTIFSRREREFPDMNGLPNKMSSLESSDSLYDDHDSEHNSFNSSPNMHSNDDFNESNEDFNSTPLNSKSVSNPIEISSTSSSSSLDEDLNAPFKNFNNNKNNEEDSSPQNNPENIGLNDDKSNNLSPSSHSSSKLQSPIYNSVLYPSTPSLSTNYLSQQGLNYARNYLNNPPQFFQQGHRLAIPGPINTKYHGFSSSSLASQPSSSSFSKDLVGSTFYAPFSFDSFAQNNNDQFGSAANNDFNAFNNVNYNSFKSGANFGTNDFIDFNDNWYMNQPFLPLMMKHAYPIVNNYNNEQGQNYGQQQLNQPTDNSNQSLENKEKESKTKNKLRFNLNKLQSIRLNNIKLPNIFSWGRNLTTTTTQSSTII